METKGSRVKEGSKPTTENGRVLPRCLPSRATRLSGRLASLLLRQWEPYPSWRGSRLIRRRRSRLHLPPAWVRHGRACDRGREHVICFSSWRRRCGKEATARAELAPSHVAGGRRGADG